MMLEVPLGATDNGLLMQLSLLINLPFGPSRDAKERVGVIWREQIPGPRYSFQTLPATKDLSMQKVRECDEKES